MGNDAVNIYNLLKSLGEEERRVLNYFLNNISVGEIVATRELKVLEKIGNPEEVIDRLVEKGLLERGTGCINLAKEIREEVYRKQAGKR